jgi:hypothetical protein
MQQEADSKLFLILTLERAKVNIILSASALIPRDNSYIVQPAHKTPNGFPTVELNLLRNKFGLFCWHN